VCDFYCVIAVLNNVYLYKYLCKNLCEICVKLGLPSELHAAAEHSALHAGARQIGRARRKGMAMGGEEKIEGEEKSINKG
jgi:hypothetical protein